MDELTIDPAFASITAELQELMPSEGPVVDAHTHLGLDEDGRSLSLPELIAYLDEVGPETRACVFPLHDPERRPAYRVPNDRVLEWARESDGRLAPYCRLDPGDGPVAEAERCLALGARGIKLHPRAQAFGFGNAAAESIFEVARDAGVPILIHTGRGMPPMATLADLALRYPEVTLVLAHAGIADQGTFAARLADHPRVVYDTSNFSVTDVVELFARVPAERIVFGSDPPYGRPIGGMYQTLRVCAYAGLDAEERAMVIGGTMTALLEGRAPALPRPPRVAQVRPVSGRLARANNYLLMAFAAVMGSGPPPDPTRALPNIALARAVCRDPDPGEVGPVLERIDSLLAAAEHQLAGSPQGAFVAIRYVMAAGAIAGTEPVGAEESATVQAV